jgi:hypothetical protein
MVLAVLTLAYIIIMAAAGGLWLPGTQAVTLVLSLVTFFVMLKNRRAKRLSSPQLMWPLLLLAGCLSLFLVPLEFLPIWLISAERAQIDTDMQSFLTLAFQSPLFTPFTSEARLGLNYWGTLRFLTTFLLFANVLYLVSTLRRRSKIHFTYILIGGGLIVAGAGLVGEFVYAFKEKIWWALDYDVRKPIACFGLPNHYGIFLTLFLPFCLVFAIHAWKKEAKGMFFLWVLIYILVFLGMTVSFSRGAYAIALLVSVGILFIGRGSAAQKTGAALVSFVLILLFAWMLPEKLAKEYGQGLNELTRIEIYETAPEIITDFPQGVGPLAYRFNSMSYLIGDKDRKHIAHHSESTPFQYLQEWGLFPFLLWLGLLAGFVKSAIDCYKRGKVSRRLAGPAFIALVAVALHGQYDFPYAVPIYSFTIASIAGLLLSRGEIYDSSIHSSWKCRQGWVALLLPLLSLFYISTTFFSYGDTLYRDRYSYGEKQSLQQLAELLPQQPSSWHTWYWLGRRSWENDNLELAEICFKQVTVAYPNHAIMWDYLARVRYLQGKKKEAAAAYRIYFLMVPTKQRIKNSMQARGLLELTQEEVEKLYYIKLPKNQLTRKYLRSI